MKLCLLVYVIISIKMINADNGCTSVQNNTLRSPGYPNSYPSNMDCVYEVPIPFDQALVISFNFFHLEYLSNCGYDYLRITNSSNHTIGTYCGLQTGRGVLVTGSAAVLYFHTDHSLEYNGFELAFSFYPRDCKEALSDPFGHLNITNNERFNVICTWTIGNNGLAEQVAIVSIEEIHFVYCSEHVKVLDGSGALFLGWEGCRKNDTSETFLEIPFEESQNVTIQVLLENRQSYLKVDYGILKDGLFSATYLAGWKIIFENRTSNSLQLRWMDINDRLNADVRFFVVIAKSSHNIAPVRKLFSPNITSVQITDLAPYTEYNVSVVAIDTNGSPFESEFLLAMTDEGVPSSAPSTLFVTNISSNHVTIQWSPIPRQYHNGRLLGYKVFFQKASNASFPVDEGSVTVSNSTWVILKTLDPGQRYKIYVSAFTSKGDGPRSRDHFVTTACWLSVNLSVGLIDVAPAADYDPFDCSWIIGKVGITNAVALFIIQSINLSSCRYLLPIALLLMRI
ncbi:MAM and fibronectin type III domain-containing protein 1-like [Montipora foliosa]|uniref:MAM and fibronectin type III domain-containing protein 1-like n=1 Tax=Montipora foliosa TaxID=591990 RepID=UPI0035F12716